MVLNMVINILNFKYMSSLKSVAKLGVKNILRRINVMCLMLEIMGSGTFHVECFNKNNTNDRFTNV